MALTLIATAGASNANTYSTLAEAETYFEKRLHKSDWTDETDANKNIALVMSTRLLDEYFLWHGFQYSSSQALLWPRSNVFDVEGNPVTAGTIPDFLKDATAEFAMFLLAEDKSVESDMKGYKSIKIEGAISLWFDKRDRPDVIPKSVYSILRHYGDIVYREPKILVRM
jgi:hypothetical protein